MKVLHRYLLLNNLLILGMCLLTCTGIYLLVDVFDRLDRFLEKGAAAGAAGMYFAAKVPLILSQLLPAVVFLSIAVQICGLRKRRESMALEAGGVPFTRLILFFCVLGVLWSGGQLLFSQVLGVRGQQLSESIWDSLDDKGEPQAMVLRDVWLRDVGYVINFQTVWPNQGRGRDVAVYVVGQGFQGMQRSLRAKRLQVTDQGWKLYGVTEIDPQAFSQTQKKTVSLPITQDLSGLQVSQDEDSPEEMSLWTLASLIERLRNSGVNVEALRTAWHLKLSYAMSTLVLAIVALVLTRRWDNLFMVISLGLGVIFVFYSLYVMGGTLGESGALPPWLGAWLGNLVVGLLGVMALVFQVKWRG